MDAQNPDASPLQGLDGDCGTSAGVHPRTKQEASVLVDYLTAEQESQIQGEHFRPTWLVCKYMLGAPGGRQVFFHWPNLRLHPAEGLRLQAVYGRGLDGALAPEVPADCGRASGFPFQEH